MPAAVSIGAEFKPCILIPVYNHGLAISQVLQALQPLGVPCVLIDDGSDAACAAELQDWASKHPDWIELHRLAQNQGKGAAMRAGFFLAEQRAYSHALQIDADGQHDIAAAKAMLEDARKHPDHIICGVPQFDDSVPKGRLYGRYITHFWVWINTSSRAIGDSMCGFRVYPLLPTLELLRQEPIGQRMDFDTDIIVRLFWRGVGVVNRTTRVHYPLDGVSHFALWADNVRITRMHTRLFFTMLWRRFGFGRPIVSRNRKN
ncbi:MAG: glycosyltransferase family 2 protein [Oceanococcus sp.]